MQQVLVSDTSVLIDLKRGSLLEVSFRLAFRFVVPDLLYERELKKIRSIRFRGQKRIHEMTRGCHIDTAWRVIEKELVTRDELSLRGTVRVRADQARDDDVGVNNTSLWRHRLSPASSEVGCWRRSALLPAAKTSCFLDREDHRVVSVQTGLRPCLGNDLLGSVAGSDTSQFQALRDN